jgi:WhiB family transcriptional regulator, redox-sensing transcriptional regulator
VRDLVSAIVGASEWMDKANCKNMDTNLFFPSNGQNITHFVAEVCNQCPVIEECLWYANETHADVGVFGGMSGNQRKSWRKRNRVELGMSMSDWQKRRAS